VSADILRRAAALLRERGTRLPGAMADRPWRLILTDSESLDGVAACSHHCAEDADCCDGCWPIETPHEFAAQYIAMMHPPVALALADWLDVTAQAMADSHAADPDDPVELSDEDEAVALARAILREDG
jgi:hypothetical protein